MSIKYTKILLQEIVIESKSIADVIRKLNLKLSGGNYSYIKKRINFYEISIEHFTGQASMKGISPPNKRTLEEFKKEVLCYEGVTINSHTLKLKLYEFELKNKKCEECKINSEWNGKYLSLHLDHINGNNLDNRIENLRILCPNCHSQTNTYSGKRNKGKGQSKEEKLFKINNPCIDCNCLIGEGAIRCKSCKATKQSREKRGFDLPTKEELFRLLSKNTFTKVAKFFNVSDNAVRKWCVKYDMSIKSSDYKNVTYMRR